MRVTPPDISIRRAHRGDVPRILSLARRSLGWTDDDARFLEWKHFDSPFGESPMWIGESGDTVVGFRAFLRWELKTPDGRRLRAVRAVDTATDPSFQGRGIFTTLTLAAVDELRTEGVDLVFNTPNDKSRPGYVKMGWTAIGLLPTEVRPTRWRFPIAISRARQSAERDAVSTDVGQDASDAFADASAIDALLATIPSASGLTTRRTAAYLAWRYGSVGLGYRVAHTGAVDAGIAVFRLRRRGRAVEAVVNDVLVPAGDGRVRAALMRTIASAGADYLLRIGSTQRSALPSRDGFIRLPRTGPILACLPLQSSSTAPPLQSWSLTMGDVELL